MRQCSPEAAFLLAAGGELRLWSCGPSLRRSWEKERGFCCTAGEFRVEPLEIQIEFM